MTSLLTAGQREQFAHDGYLVLPALVPEPLCQAVIAAIGDFLEIDPTQPRDWHRHRLEGHGIVPLHHAQALWELRQWPALYQLFTEVLGESQLAVSHDRVSFKAPRAGWSDPVRDDPFHWDCNPDQAIKAPLSVQGLIYLDRVEPDGGGFCCLPELFQTLPQWLTSNPEKRRISQEEASNVTELAGPAGTVVIWNRLLPHSSAPNLANRPRLVQYVTMHPANRSAPAAERARECLQRRPPSWAIRQRVPGQRDPEPGPPPRLSPLGRRLAGVDPWPEQPLTQTG